MQKRSKAQSDSQEDGILQVLKYSIKARKEREKNQDSDDDRLFLLSLLNSLKKVLEPRKLQVRDEQIQVITSHSSQSSNNHSSYQSFPYDQWRIQKILVGGDLKHKTSKIRMSSPKLRVIFRPNSEIQTFFSPKFRWSPKKKKKKKRSSPKLRVIFCRNSEIQTFFSPKFRWSPKIKKKKKVFTKIENDFSAEIGNSNVFFAQIQVVSKKKKKKKRSSPKLRLIFRRIRYV